MNVDNCIFCDLVKYKKAFIVWEDENFMAFLSIFPNTPGVTVVIPKVHYSSYVFENENELVYNLLNVTKTVAKILEEKLNVKRVGLVFEGLGVNHLHAKLFPLHGLGDAWKPVSSKVNTFFEQYPGYISSHDSNNCSMDEIKNVHTQIMR